MSSNFAAYLQENENFIEPGRYQVAFANYIEDAIAMDRFKASLCDVPMSSLQQKLLDTYLSTRHHDLLASSRLWRRDVVGALGASIGVSARLGGKDALGQAYMSTIPKEMQKRAYEESKLTRSEQE